MLITHFRAVNFKADSSLKKFIQSRVQKLSLFHKQIIKVFVFTKVENSFDSINKFAELKINLPGDVIIIKKISRTFEESISKAIDSAKRTLIERKEKKRFS